MTRKAKEAATQMATSAGSTSFSNPLQELALRGGPQVVAAGLVVAAHAWFLWYLQAEYEALPDKSDLASVTDYVDLWVPIFLLSMFAEAAWAKYKEVRLYRVNDTLSSLSLGVLSLLTKKLAAKALAFFPYVYVWEHFAVTRAFATNGALAWWLMFAGKEFSYYWLHRQGHTIAAFWAMHSVHHSSEEYNLAAALRQSALHSSVSWLYDLPLALFFPPALFVIHSQFNLLYQFWIHTPVIGKLGPLEYVLNTPSQHRVHHGKNVYCIDKNYGGTLCIFDRLFGTFQEELDQIPIVYGVVHPINTFNPVEANATNWRYIGTNFLNLKGLRNKLGTLYFGPGWIPGASSGTEEYPIPPTSTDSTTKYDPRVPAGVSWYILAQFGWALVLLTVAIDRLSSTLGHTSLFSAYITWTLLNIGGISDRKSWAFASEVVRLVALVPLGSFAVSLWDESADLGQWAAGFAAWSIVSALYLFAFRAGLARPLKPAELGRTNRKQALIDQTEQHRLALRACRGRPCPAIMPSS